MEESYRRGSSGYSPGEAFSISGDIREMKGGKYRFAERLAERRWGAKSHIRRAGEFPKRKRNFSTHPGGNLIGIQSPERKKY